MNYMAELNAFYSRLAASPLTADAQACWHLLMNIANRAGWPRSICVSEGIITGTLQISHGSFIRVRAELIGAGLIQHLPQKGRKAPRYILPNLAGEKSVHKSGLTVLKTALPSGLSSIVDGKCSGNPDP